MSKKTSGKILSGSHNISTISEAKISNSSILMTYINVERNYPILLKPTLNFLTNNFKLQPTAKNALGRGHHGSYIL